MQVEAIPGEGDGYRRILRFPRGRNSDRFPVFDRQVFRVENNICVAFNGIDPSYIPCRKDVLSMWPSQYKKCALSSDEMPYVAMVLAKPRYDHSVLRTLRLDHDFGLEYIDEGKGGVWQLPRKTQTLWLDLQNIIYLTIREIQKYTGGVMSHLELEPPRRRPLDFGFMQQYKRKEDARRAVLNSRGSFDLLLAFLAFYMCNSSSLRQQSSAFARTVGWDGWPGWAQNSLENKVLHPAWVDMLLFSEISDFSLRRVGCYIVPGSCEWLHLVPNFLSLNIPIGFLYPVLEKDYARFDSNSLSKIRFPHYEEMVALKTREREHLERDIKLNLTLLPVVPTPDVLVQARATAGMSPAVAREPPLASGSLVVPYASSVLAPSSPESEPPRKKARLEPKWKSHLDARIKLEELSRRYEAPEGMALRLKRIEDANQLKIQQGASVFRWIEDMYTGERKQNKVGKRKKNKTLRKYAPSQIYYWSYCDEWDVCTDFDPDAIQPEGSDDESRDGWDDPEADEDFPVMLPPARSKNLSHRQSRYHNSYQPDFDPSLNEPDFDPFPNEPEPNPSSYLPGEHDTTFRNSSDCIPQITLLSSEAWEQFFLGACGIEYETRVSETEETDRQFGVQTMFLDVVRLRYGFNPLQRVPAYANHPKFDRTMGCLKLRRFFQDATSKNDWKDDDTERHLQNFYHFLNNAESPPYYLWDLSPEHPRYLGNTVSSVQIAVHACTVDGGFACSDHRRNLFSLSVVGGEPCPWNLFVEDPSVAVECLRCDFKSTLEIAKAFLLRGTPFYTAAEIPAPVPQREKYSFECLGLRKADYQPDLADIAAYESEYLRFIQTPRGRAVFKSGGLYWRIALFVLESVNGSIEQELSLLSGPSEDLGTATLSIHDVACETTYMDDTLTDGELAFLSGVYIKSTSECILSSEPPS